MEHYPLPSNLKNSTKIIIISVILNRTTSALVKFVNLLHLIYQNDLHGWTNQFTGAHQRFG